MNKVTEYILMARPKSAESSVKTYERLINKFTDHTSIVDNPEDTSWVEDINYVEKKLEKMNLKPTTLRNYYVALMIYVEGVNGGKFTDKWEQLSEYKYYKDKVDTINGEYKQNASENGATPKQQENMVSKQELVDMLLKIRPLTATDNSLFMAYVLFNLYLEFPVRNELATLKLINKSRYNKLKKEKMNVDNYIIVEKTKTSIIRNGYKTSKTHGEVVNVLSNEVKVILGKWLRDNKIKKNEFVFPLLQPKGDATYSTAELNLTKLLQRVTDKYLGKKISTTILAKINISDKIDPEQLKLLMSLGRIRGTSLNNLAPIYANIVPLNNEILNLSNELINAANDLLPAIE